MSETCKEPALDDRKIYRNLYRLGKSVKTFAPLRIAFAKSMNWNEIAIISDTSQYTYVDSTYFMQQALANNLTITAEAFFSVDPTDAVRLLKKFDARVIFSICYIDTCPAVACEAYKQGMYGPNYVWMFSNEISLQGDINRPPGCTEEMTDAFAEGALFVGYDLDGSAFDFTYKAQLGHTAVDVAEYVAEQNPNLVKSGLYGLRLICYETLEHAAFIIDLVEKQLQEKGETLANLALESSRRNELEEIFRGELYNLDINTTWGPSRKSALTTPELYFQTIPVLTVKQNQNLKRELISVFSDEGTFEMKRGKKFIWQTPDGKPPNDGPIVVRHRRQIPRAGVVVAQVISTLVLILNLCTLAFFIKERNKNVFNSTFRRFNIGIFIGCSLPVIAIWSVPAWSHDLTPFCFITPAISALSLFLIRTCLAMKLLSRVFCGEVVKRQINALNGVKKKCTFIFALLTCLAISLIIAFYSTHEQPKVKLVEKSQDLSNGELQGVTKVVVEEWFDCISTSFYIGWIFLGFLTTLVIFGFFSSLFSTTNFCGISDYFMIQNISNILFPMTVIYIAILTFLEGESTKFAVLCFYFFFENSVVLVMFWRWVSYVRKHGNPMARIGTIGSMAGSFAVKNSKSNLIKLRSQSFKH